MTLKQISYQSPISALLLHTAAFATLRSMVKRMQRNYSSMGTAEPDRAQYLRYSSSRWWVLTQSPGSSLSGLHFLLYPWSPQPLAAVWKERGGPILNHFSLQVAQITFLWEQITTLPGNQRAGSEIPGRPQLSYNSAHRRVVKLCDDQCLPRETCSLLPFCQDVAPGIERERRGRPDWTQGPIDFRQFLK